MSEGNSRVPDLEPDAMSNNAGCGCVLQPQTSSATASSQLTGPTTSSDPTITISITPTTGGQFDITVDKNESIENLKKIISKRLKVAKERICLLHRERQLREGTLEENRLQDGSRLTLLPSVETGLLKPRYQVQRGLQHSVLSLQAQRPEQSVMQALESLSDSQVNDFLSGKAPLNLTMRLGDHMMLIQLQLSTVTPANAATAAPASLPPQPQQQQQPIQPVQQQQEIQQQQQQQQQPALDARRSAGVISGSSATTTTTAAASKLSLSSSLVSKLSAASSLFGVPSPPNTPTSLTAPCCSQQPQQPHQQSFVQPETPPVTPPGRQPQAVPQQQQQQQQQQQKQPPKFRRPSLRSSRHAFHPYTLLDLNRQTRQATKAAAAATAAASQAPKSCPSCPEASEASEASEANSAPAVVSQQQPTTSSPAEPATACCKFSDWSLILGPCDCSKLSPKNKVCSSHANISVPQEASSPMEVCTPAATTTTTTASSAPSTPTTPTTPVTPTSPDSPDTTSGDAAGNPTATLDTRALVEASRNLTQKLKQLSSEENAKRRQGAIIESMHHHGKGVYTGTFSGTLNPALQDRHGRPKRDISTIIHILNDLLCATPATTAGHYRYHRHPTTHHRAAASSVASISSPATTSNGATQTPSMFALTSSGAPDATPAGHAPAGLEATPGCPVSSAPGYSSEELSKENEATKGKMRRLRLVMEQRREKMRARRQARAAPYTTKWAAVTPDPDPNASSSSSSSSSPGSGTSSSDPQNEPELKPCSPEPVVA